MTDLPVRIVSWVRGSADDRRSGLLGYVRVRYGDLILDGVTVRRTADGRASLSFPERRNRKGGRYPIIQMVDDLARARFEREVLGEPDIAEALEW